MNNLTTESYVVFVMCGEQCRWPSCRCLHGNAFYSAAHYLTKAGLIDSQRLRQIQDSAPASPIPTPPTQT